MISHEGRTLDPSVAMAVAFCIVSVACTQAATPGCDALEVPPGFCATEFAPNVGPVRHLAVSARGVVYAATWREGRREGGVVALVDTNGDGRADVRERFGTEGGSGLVLRDSQLFLGTWSTVRRWTLPRDGLVPMGDGDAVVIGMPETEHGARSLAVDGDGHLYVNVGVPSNACERDYPRRDFRGQEPCSELASGGGIWRFRSDSTSQQFSIDARYATGLRHTVALTVDHNGTVWGAPHAIDHLDRWWPDAGYSREDAAGVPSETLHRISLGGDYGFPYCMFDARAGRYVASPAYAQSGAPRSCDTAPRPDAVLDAHSAPLALQFYEASAFPPRYRGGLFIALHGSLFRDPLPRTGYGVAFIPFENGAPSGPVEPFAAGRRRLGGSLGTALIRPSGLAVDSSGALYIADDTSERIWRVTWNGGTGISFSP